jgi:FixJ family two-component response regulator
MITVVDDDPSVRKALSRLIRAAGYNAQAYESAETFLGSGAAASSDCIILDVDLPGKSGLELQAELAESGSHRPVIFITAFADDQARSQALETGAIEFLRKPLDGQRLLEAIESALGEAK